MKVRVVFFMSVWFCFCFIPIWSQEYTSEVGYSGHIGIGDLGGGFVKIEVCLGKKLS